MEGEIFGLLGPNGAGKTTTLRMLATLIKPDEGDAVIGGYSVQKEAEQVRRKIGFLTSELRLEEFFTPNYLFDFFAFLQYYSFFQNSSLADIQYQPDIFKSLKITLIKAREYSTPRNVHFNTIK